MNENSVKFLLKGKQDIQEVESEKLCSESGTVLGQAPLVAH